jgi:hypothetical protein
MYYYLYYYFFLYNKTLPPPPQKGLIERYIIKLFNYLLRSSLAKCLKRCDGMPLWYGGMTLMANLRKALSYSIEDLWKGRMSPKVKAKLEEGKKQLKENEQYVDLEAGRSVPEEQ